MYADDIVLLSKSAEGMQEKLDKLSAFCTDWCLDINIKKNKILVFNKAGKHLSHKFVFQNNDLECVSPNKYLGIWFNNSGSFNFAQNELYQKALKALFKLKLKPQFTFFITLLSRFCYMAVKFGVILTRLPHGLEMEIFQ